MQARSCGKTKKRRLLSFLDFLDDFILPLGDALHNFFCFLDLRITEPKPDSRASHTEHHDGKHEYIGVIDKCYYIDAVDDQVTPGAQEDNQKNDLRPFTNPVMFQSFNYDQSQSCCYI